MKYVTKKNIIEIITIIAVFTIIVIANIYASYGVGPISLFISEQIIPERVSIELISSIENNERVPILVLYASVNSCSSSFSDLETEKSLDNNVLVVDIKGYKRKLNKSYYLPSPIVSFCPGFVLRSKDKISLDSNWLKQGDKEIIFKLDGQNNIYKISYNKNNYRVTLNKIKAVNVEFVEYYSSTTEVTLYPVDVAIMYLHRDWVSPDKDYRPELRDFALEKGFTPAEEIYHGIEQDDKTRLYVVLNNHSVPEYSEVLGRLPSENIKVFLKHANFNPSNY